MLILPTYKVRLLHIREISSNFTKLHLLEISLWGEQNHMCCARRESIPWGSEIEIWWWSMDVLSEATTAQYPAPLITISPTNKGVFVHCSYRQNRHTYNLWQESRAVLRDIQHDLTLTRLVSSSTHDRESNTIQSMRSSLNLKPRLALPKPYGVTDPN